MTDVANRTITVSPLALDIGAEIGGVDLTQPIEPETVAELRAALLRWKVIFFRGQHIAPEDQVRFASLFGEVTPAHPTLPALEGHPQILPLENGKETGGHDELVDSTWHTDVTFLPDPPMGSVLHALVVPPFGGDTMWTNTVAAYESLSPPIRELCDGLHAVHRNLTSLVREGEGAPHVLRRNFASRRFATVHPVVRVHPETGEKALFVNPTFTTHIVELDKRESAHLLALLNERIQQPEFTVRFRWQPDSVAFWDNRCTAHLVPRDVFTASRERRRDAQLYRRLHRVTIAGDLPTGPDGSRSRALDADAFG